MKKIDYKVQAELRQEALLAIYDATLEFLYLDNEQQQVQCENFAFALRKGLVPFVNNEIVMAEEIKDV